MTLRTNLFVDYEELKLTRNGVWLSNDSEVMHEEQCRAFFRHLRKDDEGWFIQIGRDLKRVEVEDTGHFVESLGGTAESGFTLHLSDGSTEILQAETLRYQPGRLTCRVRDGAYEAKFLSVPYTELLLGLQEDEQSYFLVLAGKRIVLSKTK